MTLNWGFISLMSTMAEKKTVLFYASGDKYSRAVELVAAKKYKTVKEAYLALGGAFSDNRGYKEV